MTEIPEIEGVSLEAHFNPARGLGGDFYNFIRINDKLIIFLSDISGHGLDGTIISVFVKETIESYLALKPDEVNPEKILTHINNQYRRDNYPDDYFVCIFLAVLDLTTYELIYSGAGMHNTSLVRLGNGKKATLESQGPPISSAISTELMDFEEGRIQLTLGTSVMFFTDGIAEQEIKGSNGVEFYDDRLKKVYFENSHFPPEILKQIIKDDFRKHNNGSLQGDDDITYVLLHLEPEEISEYR